MTRVLSLPGAPRTADDAMADLEEHIERVNARIDNDLATLTAQVQLRAAVHRHGARVLRDLGVDSPELRWKAMRALTARHRKARRKLVDDVALVLIAYGFAMDNAAKRGDGSFYLIDLLEARAMIRRYYGEDAVSVVSASNLYSVLREPRAR